MLHSPKRTDGSVLLTATRVVIASRKGRLTDVQRLVDLGANIEAKGNEGMTALIWASLYGREQVARFLLDRHADIETRTNTGITPLMCASQRGHVPVIELLCDRHAAIDALDNNNSTSALAVACMKAHVEAVRVLLTRGANADVGTNPPILIACSNVGQPKNGSDEDVATFWARRCEIVSELVRHRLAHVLANGQNALLIARRNGQSAIVVMLEEALNN
jgi:ankyrin repeat protein